MIKYILIVKMTTLFMLSFLFVKSQNNLVLNGNLDEFTFQKYHMVEGDYYTNDSFFLNLYQSTSVNVKNWKEGVYTVKPNYTNSGNIFLSITIFDIASVQKQTYRYSNAIGKLCKKLEKGNKYIVSFYIKPNKGDYYTNHIEVALIDTFNYKLLSNHFETKIKKKQFYAIDTNEIKVDYSYNKLLTDTISFTKISFNYIADGNEKYILIGNVSGKVPELIEKVEPFGGFKGGMGRNFIIDDISIYSIDSNEICAEININSQIDTVLIHTELYKLNEYNKEYDSLIINKINRVIDDKHPKSLLIVGSADILGGIDYNIKLAQSRADNFKEFLETNGITVNIKTEIYNVQNIINENDRKIDVYAIYQ
ncbi:MAG: hypothetical protein R2836_08600 [Chitinophagales bacterium]|nr:hypothetical protein [Bacteroidota bacterium]